MIFKNILFYFLNRRENFMKTFGSVGLEGIKWTVMIRFLEKAQHMNYNFLFLFLNNSFRLPISSKSPIPT